MQEVYVLYEDATDQILDSWVEELSRVSGQEVAWTKSMGAIFITTNGDRENLQQIIMRDQNRLSGRTWPFF